MPKLPLYPLKTMSVLASRNTRVLIQGITGREASFFTRESLLYSTKIVAGVTPGKGGQRVYGIPVYDCVRQACEQQAIDASVISVPPLAVRDAAFEAIENGIKLLVVITERVPKRDVCELVNFAHERGARIIGPNSLGIICPGETKLGGIGGTIENTLKTFTKGPVGVISRSGGMMSEIANLLTQNGIGQSTCVSIGGDALLGSDFVDLFPLFQQDSETKALLLFCEPGGAMEEEFAEFYAAQKIRRPVAAFVAGKFVDQIPGTRFGHSAVMVEGQKGTTKKKIELLRSAGVVVADKLSDLPRICKELLNHGHVY